METALWIVLAALVLLPMAVWIGALVWAARRDGREEDDFRRAREQIDPRGGPR